MAGANIVRWLIGLFGRLPPRQRGRLRVESGLAVPMRDGVTLLADHYQLDVPEPGPVVLMRSPYGRGAIFAMMAALIAERGFQVLLQSVRGTAGSGGELDPMRQERDDGADTVGWIRAQAWFPGQLFTFGVSYLGNVQWAIASAVPEQVDGLALGMTLANFRDEIVGFGDLTQAGTLGWTQTALMMQAPDGKMRRPKPDSLDAAHRHLPVGTMDRAAFGRTVPWWQDWVNHEDPEDPWWQAIDHSAAVGRVQAPTTMIAGWRDIFLPFQVRDFEARQAAGREAWLTIGPWNHFAPGGMLQVMRQSLDFFRALKTGGGPHRERDRVRLYLQGVGEWREYPSWPPPGGRPLSYHLQAGGGLAGAAPEQPGSTEFTYDPADPTPALHGPTLMGGAKIPDMRKLEARPDTVTFTAQALERDLDVIGPVRVELAVRSDRQHTDFYACLCDVDRKGRSLHVCDGYLRLRPGRPATGADGVRKITLQCWPTAYRFHRGHRLRLIIASGAHPRYARNPGTGEPMATATELVAARQQVLHGPEYGSSLHLRVMDQG